MVGRDPAAAAEADHAARIADAWTTGMTEAAPANQGSEEAVAAAQGSAEAKASEHQGIATDL